jgi:TPP-dependent trihydroxycyclohexane-1,2-dione (THcHDO) dehydratase
MAESTTQRMTMAQAVIAFLKNQYSERDGLGGCPKRQPFLVKLPKL